MSFDDWYNANYRSKLKDFSAYDKCKRSWNARNDEIASLKKQLLTSYCESEELSKQLAECKKDYRDLVDDLAFLAGMEPSHSMVRAATRLLDKARAAQKESVPKKQCSTCANDDASVSPSACRGCDATTLSRWQQKDEA